MFKLKYEEEWDKYLNKDMLANAICKIDKDKTIKRTFIKSIYYKIKYYVYEVKRFIEYIKEFE